MELSLSTRSAPLPPPPEVGDFAPAFNLPDEAGRPVLLRGDQIAGKLVLLIFAARDFAADARAALAAAEQARRRQAVVFAIRNASPAENAELVKQHALPFSILSDPGDGLRRLYGFAEPGASTALVLASPNQRVLAIARGAEAFPALLERLEQAASQRISAEMAPHPPVLLVPEVLSRAECRRLIELYERPDWPLRSAADHLEEQGSYKIEINDYGRVDRIDFAVQDAETVGFIDLRLRRRVLPEIRKAFQYAVTKRERFHIARYECARGGFQHGHRDNPTPELAHRRFALSLNLNKEDYEGGALRFPEYGEQRYRAPTGAALIFSSSLYHEVLEVTAGRRYVLLSHLYGADARGQMSDARQRSS